MKRLIDELLAMFGKRLATPADVEARLVADRALAFVKAAKAENLVIPPGDEFSAARHAALNLAEWAYRWEGERRREGRA